MEATHDMPATEPFAPIPYEEWEDHVLRHPLFTTEGSFVAIVDGDAAAVSLLTVDHETGAPRTCSPARAPPIAAADTPSPSSSHRSSGRPRTAMTKLVTYNDETNAPMLAINRRLGYVARRAARRVLAQSGNGFFASAARTCDVTHTGVVTYFAE